MYECDIVFLFDTSGSMGDHISKVKDVVENFTTDLQNYDVDYRLGIVTFEYDVQTYDFTNSINSFKATVNSILNTSGGYENGLTAIEEAMKMNFRSNAGKYFIMLTDEPYEESSSKSTEIINKLKSNKVRLDVISLNGDGCNTAYKPITEATGGGFYDINGHIPKIFQNIIVGANIPQSALDYNGHSYAVYSDVVSTWEEAKIYCENQGGYLAVINNSSENQAIYNYITELGYKKAYFGLTDSKKEGTWEWSTGDSVNYTNWATGEPNSESSNEDYAEFYYKYTDGKWNDGNFGNGTLDDSKTFICEWDNEDNPDTNSARTFYLNPGYNQGDGYKYEGGLFVTNFNFEKTSNGKNFVTFDVYNTKDANGIVEYYDENGKFLGADLIEPHSAVIKDFNSWWEKAKNTFDSLAKYGFGDVPITHPSVSTHTSIKDVPIETSKIIVTNNQAESIYAYVYNIVDNFFNGVEVIKSLKNIVQGYDAFKNSDTTQAFIDKTKGKIVEQLIHKIQETLVNLDVQGELKEFTAETVKYETGMSLLKKFEEYNIKELVLQDFDLQQAFYNALEYAIENSGQVISDQVADMAFNIGSKLFEGNPAILGLQAINLVGNSLDSLSKFITQKQLKNSKPMIFQLGVSQSSVSNNLAPVNDSYDYNGGNKDINDYVIGEKIEFRSDYSGFDFTDKDFRLKSSSGDLTIKNARDKIMDVAVNGNTVAYAYMASGSGEINGSGLSPLEVIIGGNNLANQIIAGSGGSSLWGGSGGNDVLIGGSGQDNFFYGKNDGSDVINNASSNDIVYLYDVSLSDITAATTSGNKISVTFNTGNNLQINSAENLSPTFNLSDGNWKFNHSSGQWQGV